MTMSARLPMRAEPENVTAVRERALRKALENSDSFRRFMSNGRAKRPLRDEEELTWMLLMEMTRSKPRRSMVKRIHGAITNVRQRREWEELEQMLERNS